MQKTIIQIITIAGLLGGCTCDLVFYVPSFEITFEPAIEDASEYEVSVEGVGLCTNITDTSELQWSCDEDLSLVEDNGAIVGIRLLQSNLSGDDAVALTVHRNGDIIADASIEFNCKAPKKPFSSCTTGSTICTGVLSLN